MVLMRRKTESERKSNMESSGSGCGGAVVGEGAKKKQQGGEEISCFQMPLHYPKYSKADYETMPESELDRLLSEYGFPPLAGGVEHKRKFAMGAFLWPKLSL